MTGDARQIHVIITDDDRGMKAALSEVFSDIQQQLCRWHIQKNALKNLAEKWVRPDTRQLERRAPLAEEHTYFGLGDMWKSVCTAEDFRLCGKNGQRCGRNMLISQVCIAVFPLAQLKL